MYTGVFTEQFSLCFQADLANVDRRRTPWLIGVIHAPWYSSNSAHLGDGEEMRKSMELVLKQAKVDLIFAGHVHAYERTVCGCLKAYCFKSN